MMPVVGADLSQRLVSDELWEPVAPLQPSFAVRPQAVGPLRVMSGRSPLPWVYVLTSGCAWRHLPPTFDASPATAHRRFTVWTEAGPWRRLHRAVLDELGARGEVDWTSVPSRRPATELRCAVSLPPSVWSSRPPVSTVRSAPLAERLQALADPRRRRGKRHPFVAVLLIACSAVVTGATSFAAISEWAADAPQDVLARLGARTATALGVRIPPSGATIRRIVKDTCPGGLADLLGHDPAGCDTLALDGKSARGSRLGASPAAHLLAAMTGIGMTVTQLRVPEKTNETTCFAALLESYDLQGVTVTSDAAKIDPNQQRGAGGHFVALRRDLALGDHGLARVEHGGKQVDGGAAGAGSAHGLAVDGQTDQSVAGFVDRVGGVPGEPGAHRVVQGVAAEAGQESSQRGGVRRGGGQSEPFSQLGVGIGGEAGDGGQRLGSTEDGEQAQCEQGAQAVAAAPDPAGIGYPAQHLGQAGELRRFRIRAGGVGVPAVALQDTDQGGWHANATPVHDQRLRQP